MACYRQRRAQRGAISVMAVLFLGLALSVAALGVDIGSQFWAKRHLQKAVDLASLSAVGDVSQAAAIAAQIAAANGFNPAAQGNSLTATAGIYDEEARNFTPGGDASLWNAVRVTAVLQTPYYFMPGAGQTQASATAMRRPTAGFSLGSLLLRLGGTDPNLINGVLGGLLGGSLSLDVLSYQGLAAANVTLRGVQTALGLGSVSELVGASLTLGQLLDAGIAVLNDQGNASAALTLGQLRASVSSALPAIAVGDLLKLDPDNPESAASAEVNVLQLVTLAAQIANANSGSLIKVPALGVSLPGIASIDFAMTMVNRPAIAIGPARQKDGAWVTTAHGAATRLRLNLTLLQAISGGVVSLPLYLEAGGVDASLTGIQCRAPKDNSVVTIDTQPQVVSAYVGSVSDAAMTNKSVPVTVAPATLVNVLGVVRVEGLAQVQLAQPGEELQFSGPFDQNNTQAASGASLGLGGLLGSNLQTTTYLLGLPLLVGALAGSVVNALLALLGGILGPVLDGLLDPLLSLLGIRLGGGDVTAFYLNCGAPRLVQ